MHRLTVTLYSITVVQKRGNYMKFSNGCWLQQEGCECFTPQLISLVVNKGTDEYIRVKVDTENYRQRRKETLENLAKNISYRVKRTKRPVSLEPMNPYERRIIHSALQNDRFVTTHSEGEEPYRRVVVTLKR